MGENTRGRDAGISTWEAIRSYIKNENDKGAEFSVSSLESVGYSYSKKGFQGLVARGVIKIIGRDYAKQRNVYRLGDNIMGMRLDDILSLSYHETLRINNKS